MAEGGDRAGQDREGQRERERLNSNLGPDASGFCFFLSFSSLFYKHFGVIILIHELIVNPIGSE
jgi:hypothetical protein